MDDPGTSGPSGPSSPSHLLLPGQTGQTDSPSRSPSKNVSDRFALAAQRAREKEPTPPETADVAGPPAEERVVLNARALLERHKQAALDAQAEERPDSPDDDRFALMTAATSYAPGFADDEDDDQPDLAREAAIMMNTKDTFFDPGPDAHHSEIGSEDSFHDEDESDITEELVLDMFPGVTEEHVEQAFKEIDYDRNGYVGASELRYLLMLQGEKPTDEEIDEMLRMLDCDGDGQVDYRTFRMILGPDSLVPFEMEAIMATSDSPEKRQKAERVARNAAKDEAGPTTKEVDLLLKSGAAFKGLYKKKLRDHESSAKLPELNPIKPGANRARPGQPKPPLPLSPNQSRIMRQAQRDAKKTSTRKGTGKGKDKGKNKNPAQEENADGLLERSGSKDPTQKVGLRSVEDSIARQNLRMSQN